MGLDEEEMGTKGGITSLQEQFQSLSSGFLFLVMITLLIPLLWPCRDL